MKSHQSKNILTINVDKLRDILGVSLIETSIQLPKGTDVTTLVDKLIHDISGNFYSHVASLDGLANSYKLLASLINTNLHSSFLGRPELLNDRYLMVGIVSIINRTIDEFSKETLKKFIPEDDWIEAYKEQQKPNIFNSYPWQQKRGSNPGMHSTDEFGVPNGGDLGRDVQYPPNHSRFGTPHGIFSGNPPGGSPFAFPSQPPKEMVNTLRIDQLTNVVMGLEKNLNSLGVTVIRLVERLDNVQSQPTSDSDSDGRGFMKLNLVTSMKKIDELETYANDLGKAVSKLNTEMEILSHRLFRYETDVAKTAGFQSSKRDIRSDQNDSSEVKVDVAATPMTPISNETEDKRADGNTDSWASIESIAATADDYYKK